MRAWVSRLWPAATFQFCFIASLAMLKPAANALVLSRFSSGALPYLYLAAGLITGALAVAATGEGRRSRPGWLAATGAISALALAGGVFLELPFTSLLAYLFTEAYATQVSLAFWGSMANLYDAREARRAFTLINGVGMSGAIFGGLSAQGLTAWGAPAMVLLFGGSVLLWGAFIAFRFQPPEEQRKRRPVRRASLVEVLSVPYTRILAGFILLFAVLQILTDFVFRERAVDVLSERDMAGLFASHQLWTGVVCVLFQFVLAELLLRRMGVLRYLGLVPMGAGVLTMLALAWPSVWSAWGLKVFEGAASWSLLPVVMQLLYAPLPDELKDRARRTIDGLLRKAGLALGGVVVLAVAGLVGATGLLVLAGLSSVAMGMLLVRFRPRYVEAIHALVSGVKPEAVYDAQERLLTDAFKSRVAQRVLRVAELLDNAGRLQPEHVRMMLDHPQVDVQLKGVELAEQARLTTVARSLEELLARGSGPVQPAAAWALARLNPQRAAVVLPPYLDAPDPALMCAAVGGLLSVSEERFPEAGRRLTALLERSGRALLAERRAVAVLLGRLHPDGERTEALRRLLDDPDASVRRPAMLAVGQGRYLELGPRLLRFLTWRDDRAAAREALAALGDAAVPLLADALADRSRSLSVRLQLPRVLRLIGTQAAMDALWASRGTDELALEYRVGGAMSRLHDEAGTLAVDRARAVDWLERLQASYLSLLAPHAEVRAAVGKSALLTRVLADRLDQLLELSFVALGMLHDDARVLRRAHAQFTGTEARRKAWAWELLENVLPAEEQALIRPQLERYHRALPATAPQDFEATLLALLGDADPLVRGCARAVARRLTGGEGLDDGDDMSDQTLRKLFALEGVEVFAQNDVDDLAALAAVAKEQAFRKGDRVYAEGDPGDALYVIVEGQVEARRDGEVVLTMGARESFGETSLFDGAPRINEVVATSDTTVLVIDRRDFLDLLADRPELLGGMFRVLSRQLKSMVVEVAARRATTGEMQVVSPRPPGPSPAPLDGVQMAGLDVPVAEPGAPPPRELPGPPVPEQ